MKHRVGLFAVSNQGSSYLKAFWRAGGAGGKKKELERGAASPEKWCSGGGVRLYLRAASSPLPLGERYVRACQRGRAGCVAHVFCHVRGRKLQRNSLQPCV